MSREKILGCWLGKAVGGTLGQTFEGLEGPLVERAAAPHVTYSQGQVVDEGKRHGQRHLS